MNKPTYEELETNLAQAERAIVEMCGERNCMCESLAASESDAIDLQQQLQTAVELNQIREEQLQEELQYVAEIQAQCAAMREALEAWRVCWEEENIGRSLLQRACDLTEKALAPDAGKALLVAAEHWCNLRPTLQGFARLMEMTLWKNDYKKAWRGVRMEELLEALLAEVTELSAEVDSERDPKRIVAEAADVANFAMFIADVVGGLSTDKNQKGRRQ